MAAAGPAESSGPAVSPKMARAMELSDQVIRMGNGNGGLRG